MRAITTFVIAAALVLGCARGHAYEPPQGLIILCYHDVPGTVDLDDYGVDRGSFVETVEYFRAHGYTFISLEDLLAANRSGEPLSPRSVMLTFDDGYETFYEFVYPLLGKYKIPSTLAVVTSWIDGPAPEYVRRPLMTWDQIREVSDSPYVEVISHSHDLHKGIVYNPQGNEAPAAASRLYDPQVSGYEEEGHYLKRIKEDLAKSKKILEAKTGKSVQAIAWPFGKYNALSQSEAQALGFEVSFTLIDKRADAVNLGEIERYMVFKNPTIKELLVNLNLLPWLPEQQRAMQVDLDQIYSEDPAVTERNLSLLLDRVKAMAVSTVYLQAFSDPAGDGNIREVYFPNRVLPVKADLFNRVVHQLKTRSLVEVYAWMPMLSLTLPDADQNERLAVRENKEQTTQLTTSWYRRLTPFSDETFGLLRDLYEDMAMNADVGGVIFQDDGYLNDFEDYNPAALAYYEKRTGEQLPESEQLTGPRREEWTRMKTDRLEELSRSLMAAVKKYRPEAKFARTYYAPALTDPDSEEWLAQNYAQGLQLYDYVVIMAYPRMEEVKNPRRWLKGLVRQAARHEQGIEKTVFKIQAYDWKAKRWIKDSALDSWLRTLVAEGARHTAYYPDDPFGDLPRAAVIRDMMSKEDFPFKREWK